MIDRVEEVVTATRLVYTAPAADTSQMTSVVEGGLAAFTVGGSAVVVPAESLPAFAALVAAVAAAVVPVSQHVEDDGEPEPEPEPEVEPEP